MDGQVKQQAADQPTKQVSEKEYENKNRHEDESIEPEPLPSTYEELAALPVGEHVNFNPKLGEPEKTLEAFKGLPDISSNPSKKELDHFYRELLKMVQKDFKGPEDLIRQLRFQSIGNPDVEDSRYQFKENLNVEIILDASGSMAQSTGGKVKMDAAKDSILDFVNQLPEGAKVGLRVYGHKGSNADSDKKLSCSSSEIMYPISPYNEGKFQSALNKIKPTGWTPIGLALREAKKDLDQFEGTNNTNIVYLVSDGVSTCDDNPVQAAKDLYNSNISPIINVIGFDVDAEGQNQLIQIADATEGIYQKVNDESELKKELEKITDLAETWKDWKEKNMQKIERKKIQNELDIFGYITGEEYNASFERTEIELIISILEQSGKMDDDSQQYLDQKNKEYHDWILSEVGKFKEELKKLNEKSYAEAIKALEEKYQQNTR
ncbi:vWA domain-containing protein [Bacillus methanolicus]|uniref:vWA domain-containing protein n=1 Tax=Bacillus methanolicus TaxID=1471 RepID=UPI0023804BDF|nr:VWA domain-containing protein [Bacillus methanolicus]